MSDQKEVCSVKEIAAYLGVSETKVRQLIKRAAIPFLQIDGQYKFFLPVIREWLREKSAKPQSELELDPAHELANDIWDKVEGE